MGLAAGPMPGMADVLVGFVDYVEPRGGKSFGQLLCDQVAGRHGVRLGELSAWVNLMLRVHEVWSAECIIVFVKT